MHTRPLRGFHPNANKIFTLENLLNRVVALKTFRKDIRSFLELVHQRELTLKQMHLSVEAIQSDAFFVTPADLEAKNEFFPNDDKSQLLAEVSAQENPRLEMQ